MIGFQASDIGQYGIQDFTWWQGGDFFEPTSWSIGLETQSPFFNYLPSLFSMGYQGGIDQSGGGVAARVVVPEVLPGSGGSEAGSDSEVIAGGEDVAATYIPGAILIDPEERLDYTVYENAPGGIYEVERQPTDWDWYYQEYVKLNPPEEEEEVIWDDIGSLFQTGVDLYGQLNPPQVQLAQSYPNMAQLAAASAPAAALPSGVAMTGNGPACPPTGPRYAKVCLATGAVTPLRRRRRRRLLTSGDLSDLAAAKAIIGGGAGLNALVVKAVRR